MDTRTITREVAPEYNRPPEPVRKEENGNGGDPDYLNDISSGDDDNVELTFAGMSVEILGRHSVSLSRDSLH